MFGYCAQSLEKYEQYHCHTVPSSTPWSFVVAICIHSLIVNSSVWMVNAVASWDGGTMLIDVDREDTEMSAVQTQARALRSCWAGNGGLYAVDMYVFYFNIYIYYIIYIIL